MDSQQTCDEFELSLFFNGNVEAQDRKKIVVKAVQLVLTLRTLFMEQKSRRDWEIE